MPLRVLVVDDEPPIRELLTEYLRGRGMEVEALADGALACERIPASRPDVVLCDLKLPGREGLDVVRAAIGAGVPAVVMTGYGAVESAVSAHAAGVHAYLLKPFRLRDVHAALTAAIDAHAAARRRAWAEAAFQFVVDAAAATDGAAAESLLPRLSALLAANGSDGTVYDHDHGGRVPLGHGRFVAEPPTASGMALVAAVRAALLRAGAHA